jgi:hypothetical protein
MVDCGGATGTRYAVVLQCARVQPLFHFRVYLQSRLFMAKGHTTRGLVHGPHVKKEVGYFNRLNYL